jgi:hypothetical protein
MKLQLKIEDLKKIIFEAESRANVDTSLSSTVQISLVSQNDTHLGSDRVEVSLKSIFQECENQHLYEK